MHLVSGKYKARSKSSKPQPEGKDTAEYFLPFFIKLEK